MRRWGLVFAILALAGCKALGDAFSAHPQVAGTAAGQTLTVTRLADLAGRAKKVPLRPEALTGRAEEHTSELQSRQYLVCRLLLAKKKHPELARGGTRPPHSSPDNTTRL